MLGLFRIEHVAGSDLIPELRCLVKVLCRDNERVWHASINWLLQNNLGVFEGDYFAV